MKKLKILSVLVGAMFIPIAVGLLMFKPNAGNAADFVELFLAQYCSFINLFIVKGRLDIIVVAGTETVLRSAIITVVLMVRKFNDNRVGLVLSTILVGSYSVFNVALGIYIIAYTGA